MQYALFAEESGEVEIRSDGWVRREEVAPFKTQLLKWIGNKQKFAHEIIGTFPEDYGTYHEPFIGAGGVMAALSPGRAIGSDVFGPLIEIWQTLSSDPERLKSWYATRWAIYKDGDRVEQYEKIKASYNAEPNGADLLFLCRSCYGGVVRFRKRDGYMSTPCGAHEPIHPASFSQRVDIWHKRMNGAQFERMDYAEAMARAQPGDLVYCDPPYSYSQAILYGAQDFRLEDLFTAVADCKERGVRVALSIDGTKKSGEFYCDIKIPEGLFENELLVNIGRSMLRRFQMGGKTLEAEEVRDRLLLTY
jgi:DNA adenine methylase